MARSQPPVKKSGRSRRSAKPADPHCLPTLLPSAAGMDLGARQHWVAAPPAADGTPQVESFGTTTADLYALADWLQAHQVTTVAMESTGVYWIPVFEVLAARGFEVLLVNARQLRSVPGRKTDFLDCQWVQLLHSVGLLRGSFRPSETICQWRSLVRERQTLVRQRADWIRRLQKSLDQMNICIHHAVSHLTGATGLAMLRAIVAGERDPHVLARLRDRRCRQSEAQIAAQLTGHWRADHLFNLGHALGLYDHLSERIADYDREILACLQRLEASAELPAPAPPPASSSQSHQRRTRTNPPMHQALVRLTGVDLTTIDGIAPDTAAVILSELGPDFSAFPTERHFVSYLRLAPNLSQSAGRKVPPRSPVNTTTRVSSALRMAALAVGRSSTALGAYYRRIARRKGASVAVFATARKLAQLIYRLVRFGQHYLDIGAQAYEDRFTQRRLHTYTKALQSLGYQVIPIQKAPSTG